MTWGKPLTRSDYLEFIRFLPVILLGLTAKNVIGDGYWSYAGLVAGSVAGAFIGGFVVLGIERLLPPCPRPSGLK